MFSHKVATETESFLTSTIFNKGNEPFAFKGILHLI